MADISWAYGICKGAGVDTSKMTPKEVVKKADELQSKNGGAIPKDLADEQERKRFIDTMSGKDYREMTVKELREKLVEFVNSPEYTSEGAEKLREPLRKIANNPDTLKQVSDDELSLLEPFNPNMVYREKKRREDEKYISGLSEEQEQNAKTLQELGYEQQTALSIAKHYSPEEFKSFRAKYGDEILKEDAKEKSYIITSREGYESTLDDKKEELARRNNAKQEQDKKVNALKAKYGAVSISKEQEAREAEAEKYRASFERNRQALRNRLAYSNNGYVEDKKSVRAVKAELEGRFPATEAAKMLGVSAAKIKANLSPSEWHHSGGTMYNRIEYYDISKYIDLADNPDLVFDPDYAEETAIWQKMRGAKGIKD